MTSGALASLPFHVLVASPPAKASDYQAAEWLVKRHAVTVVPSVASLKALRQQSRPSAAGKDFLGVGNPLLSGDLQSSRDVAAAALARRKTACGSSQLVQPPGSRALRGPLVPLRAKGIADVGHVRAQQPLPETADEICAVAESVRRRGADVLLGDRATESQLKEMSRQGELAKYGIVHFATHGAVAGEIEDTSEPGLVLTPPTQGTATDDGYLSASEIAELRFDADWVVLSACNTAAGDGSGKEALSGLARAFFHAGARALLVSHWSVDSLATVALMRASFAELQANPAVGRSEALRRSMLRLMQDTSRPASWVPASHPAVWAPFTVVGEGGAAP